MINSRAISDLLPVVQAKAAAFLDRCAAEDIDVIVTSTYRDHESQNALYAQGRSKPGKVVTRAKGGQSWHNFRCAFDVVPLRNGKPVWGTKGEDLKLWQRLGQIGRDVGLEWAGDWESFVEFPHFQYTGGLTMAQLRSGAEIA